jgi:DNA-binding transcriptional MerR regulator
MVVQGGGDTNPRKSGVKSAAAFRTISEVGRELDIPQHVLRFWESKFSQIKPLKRGGGRRYYRPEDIALLRRIRDLLYIDGYTIRGVQRQFRESGVKAVLRGDDQERQAESPRPQGAAESGLSESTRTELETLLHELVSLRKMMDAT